MQQWHLSEQDFFSDLPQEKERFFSFSRKKTFKKGDVVFREGDPGDYCYYLESGSVKIIRATCAGKEPIFWLRKPGDMFGLAEIIDGNLRICTAQTIAPSIIYEAHRKDFESLLEASYPVSRKLMAVLGRRIRYLCEQIENLMVCDVTARVCRLLVYLSLEYAGTNKSAHGKMSFPLNLTQEDIAAMTGSCQQTISETLRDLQRQGLINVSRKQIMIIDMDKMQDMSLFS